MFNLDPNITDLTIREKDMVKAFFSMNNHQVATPEMMLEDARSYIMLFRETGGKLSSFIGLHLLQSGRKLFYAHSSNPFPEDAAGAVEDEAHCFVEGLGAMLDEVDFTTMPGEEKKRWVAAQEIFAGKQEPESAPGDLRAAQPAPRAAEAASSVRQATEPAQALMAQATPPAAALQPSSPAPAPGTPQAQPSPAAPGVPPAPKQAPPAPAPETPRAHDTVLETRQTVIAQPRKAENSEAAVREKRASSPQPSQTAAHAGSTGGSVQPAAGRKGVETARSADQKGRQDILQKAIREGIVKPSKPSLKEAQAAPGVVSRDREALARLLTSF
jgi:hypothetical protein